ncbi:hypothetical protein MTO96_008733 [Rhipicephalus appendiculatus]
MSQFRWLRRLRLRYESTAGALSLSPNVRPLRMAEQDPASTAIPQLRRAYEAIGEKAAALSRRARVCVGPHSFVDDPEKGFREERVRGVGKTEKSGIIKETPQQASLRESSRKIFGRAGNPFAAITEARLR